MQDPFVSQLAEANKAMRLRQMIQKGAQLDAAAMPKLPGFLDYHSDRLHKYSEKLSLPRPMHQFGRLAKGSAKLAGSAAMYGTIDAAKFGWGATKAAGSAAKFAYPGVNKFSKFAFGASLPQMAAVGAIGIGAFAMLSDDPVQSGQSIGRGLTDFRKSMKTSTGPSFGQRAFQQSVQGLTFGLNSRRTG